MVCVDASLVAAWLLPEELSEKALRLQQRLRSAGESLIAPSLITSEVSSILRKAIYRERVPLEFGEEAYEAFKMFPIQVYDPLDLTDSAWSWAKTVNAPHLYDMYYLALAEKERCDLWTADQRLVRLIGQRSSRARWVGDLDD